MHYSHVLWCVILSMARSKFQGEQHTERPVRLQLSNAASGCNRANIKGKIPSSTETKRKDLPYKCQQQLSYAAQKRSKQKLQSRNKSNFSQQNKSDEHFTVYTA
jgi:hypothetical protein